MKRHHKLMKSTANASLQDNDDIDFLKLRDKYPHLLQQYINKNDKIIDFTDANAMRALTTAYLLELGIIHNIITIYHYYHHYHHHNIIIIILSSLQMYQ